MRIKMDSFLPICQTILIETNDQISNERLSHGISEWIIITFPILTMDFQMQSSVIAVE